MASLIRSADEIDIRGPQLARKPDLIFHCEASQEADKFCVFSKNIRELWLYFSVWHIVRPSVYNKSVYDESVSPMQIENCTDISISDIKQLFHLNKNSTYCVHPEYAKRSGDIILRTFW